MAYSTLHRIDTEYRAANSRPGLKGLPRMASYMCGKIERLLFVACICVLLGYMWPCGVVFDTSYSGSLVIAGSSSASNICV